MAPVQTVERSATASDSPDHAAFLAERYFGSLDGLRAVSILAVIWHHTAAHALAGPLSYLGAEGVTLFFAISGFLITSLLLRERDRNGFIDVRAFYVRRSLRIFPLYYAVLLLYLALVLLIDRQSPAGRQFLGNLPYFLTYTSNWFVPLDGRTIFYFAWSLAAEEQFYLLWPAVLKRLKTPLHALAVLVGVLALLASVEMFTAQHGRADSGIGWFVSKVPLAIFFGAAGALMLHSPRGYALARPLVAGRGASTVWLIAAASAYAVPGTPRFVMHFAVATFVIACVVNRRHWLSGLLKWGPLAYIGSISYGMYLLHMLAKNLAVKGLDRLVPGAQWPVVFGVTVVVAVLAAGLSFRYFESYFLALKVRFER